MIRVLVSSCLLGETVRYHGGDARCDDPVLDAWVAEGRVVPFCPEVAGGLGTPRPPAEIRGGGGLEVLGGRAAVVTSDGDSVTEAFVRGAHDALEAALRGRAKLAILTDRSPSCGSEAIYDGTFTGALRRGQGVTTALLERHGIRVFSPRRLDEAARFLTRLESAAGEGRGG